MPPAFRRRAVSRPATQYGSCREPTAPLAADFPVVRTFTGPTVPAPYLARRNHTLEFRILERMVFRPYGQALVRRVHRRPFGYCPGRQDAIYGQPKIIKEPTGIVFLNDKDAAAITSPHSPDRFARFRKNSVASICCERHCFAFDCFGVSFQRDWGFHLIAYQPSRTTSSGR